MVHGTTPCPPRRMRNPRASHAPLREALQFANISADGKRATGEKFPINPNKG